MFSYGGRCVYDGLSTYFETGAVYGLLGKNGAGKTTLLRLIAGLTECSGGKIDIDGEIPSKRRPELLDRLYFVPETFSAPDIPVIDYATNIGMFYSGYDADAFDRYLKEFEVDPHQRFRRLSFGQRKKAIIAFALSLNTSLLLLDEPGNGLDIPSKLTLRRMLSEYSGPGRTVILSTHQVRDVEDIVDHIAVIDRGRLLLNMSTEDIGRRIMFMTSDCAIHGALFSERVTGGFVNILRKSMDDDGEPTRKSRKIDMEILFNACVNGNGNFGKEVEYAL